VKFTDPKTGRLFAFQLTDDETKDLLSKILIKDLRGRHSQNPWVYTQEGCKMIEIKDIAINQNDD
jgi:hypothetical protein